MGFGRNARFPVFHYLADKQRLLEVLNQTGAQTFVTAHNMGNWCMTSLIGGAVGIHVHMAAFETGDTIRRTFGAVLAELQPVDKQGIPAIAYPAYGWPRTIVRGQTN